MGLSFLIALVHVQIKPGIRRLKVFLVLLQWMFISFLGEIKSCPLNQIFQYFYLLYWVTMKKSVLENIERISLGWNLSKRCSLGVLLMCCIANGQLVCGIHPELLYNKKSV